MIPNSVNPSLLGGTLGVPFTKYLRSPVKEKDTEPEDVVSIGNSEKPEEKPETDDIFKLKEFAEKHKNPQTITGKQKGDNGVYYYYYEMRIINIPNNPIIHAAKMVTRFVSNDKDQPIYHRIRYIDLPADKPEVEPMKPKFIGRGESSGTYKGKEYVYATEMYEMPGGGIGGMVLHTLRPKVDEPIFEII